MQILEYFSALKIGNHFLKADDEFCGGGFSFVFILGFIVGDGCRQILPIGLREFEELVEDEAGAFLSIPTVGDEATAQSLDFVDQVAETAFLRLSLHYTNLLQTTPHLSPFPVLSYCFSQYQRMKRQEPDYTVADLSRALVREYLAQRGLRSTLECFQREDTHNKKKISKALLVDLVSLKNLCLLNKQSATPQSTLLEVLVAYLNKKYQVKKNNFANTQPQASFPSLAQVMKKNNDMDAKMAVKNKQKERPATGKPVKKDNPGPPAPVLEEKSLKVLYQKLGKMQEPQQIKTQGREASAKGRPQTANDVTSVPSFQTETVEEEEYQDAFEEEPVEVDKGASRTLEQPLSWAKKEKQNDESPLLTAARLKPVDLKEDIKPAVANIDSKIKEDSRIAVAPISDNKKPSNHQLISSVSEQKLDPSPIVHFNEPKQAQIQIRPIQPSKQREKTVEQIKIEDVSRSSRNRTQMRVMGQNKEASFKKIEDVSSPIAAIVTIRQEQKKEERSQMTKVQVKQQVKEVKVGEKTANSGGQMISIGKKRKNKEETANEASYPTKFKFDDNFNHEIVKEAVYEYKPYDFGPIIIEEKVKQTYPHITIETGINYKIKGGGAAPPKKKIEKTIASKDAERLRKVVFQSSAPLLPKSWHQGFILSPFEATPYGLKQIQGGPCGIIAAVQCYYLKHLMLCSGQSNYSDPTIREVSLVAAITDVLFKVKTGDKFTLAFPPRGATKADVNSLRILIAEANDFPTAFASIWAQREDFIGNSNHGVASLLFSTVLTRGIDKIEEQMDNKENPLIGNHGHCTQQFVNMLIAGKASSNCFDGQKLLDDYKLKGIPERAQFGFLTIFQSLRYIQVGRNLKNPIFPAWVICKEFHYHVVFGPHYLTAITNAPKFDLVYYDGLYNCGDRIRLTLQTLPSGEDGPKEKDLPLIEQVLMTKWGRRKVDWNGSLRIL